MEQVKCYVIDTRKMRKETVRVLTKRGTLVQVAGISCVVLFGMPDVSFASSETGIDVGADKIYKKLLRIAKWVIIFKGGIDTIKSVAEGDLTAVKKNSLGYGIPYAVLWGLPWMMKEIEKLFSEMES